MLWAAKKHDGSKIIRACAIAAHSVAEPAVTSKQGLEVCAITVYRLSITAYWMYGGQLGQCHETVCKLNPQMENWSNNWKTEPRDWKLKQQLKNWTHNSKRVTTYSVLKQQLKECSHKPCTSSSLFILWVAFLLWLLTDRDRQNALF